MEPLTRTARSSTSVPRTQSGRISTQPATPKIPMVLVDRIKNRLVDRLLPFFADECTISWDTAPGRAEQLARAYVDELCAIVARVETGVEVLEPGADDDEYAHTRIARSNKRTAFERRVRATTAEYLVFVSALLRSCPEEEGDSAGAPECAPPDAGLGPLVKQVKRKWRKDGAAVRAVLASEDEGYVNEAMLQRIRFARAWRERAAATKKNQKKNEEKTVAGSCLDSVLACTRSSSGGATSDAGSEPASPTPSAGFSTLVTEVGAEIDGRAEGRKVHILGSVYDIAALVDAFGTEIGGPEKNRGVDALWRRIRARFGRLRWSAKRGE